jgi:hypothetical protein
MGHRKAKNKIRCLEVTKMSNFGGKAIQSIGRQGVHFAGFGKPGILQRSDVQRLFGKGDDSSGKHGGQLDSMRFFRSRQR